MGQVAKTMGMVHVSNLTREVFIFIFCLSSVSVLELIN